MNRDLHPKSETQFPRQQCFQYICKIQVWVVHNKRDINIQKLKVKKTIFQIHFALCPGIIYHPCLSLN